MTEAHSSIRGAPSPRVLTPALRAELNLPVVTRSPYRWAFACVVVGTACLPLVLAAMWKSAAVAILLGLVVLPAVRWFESHEASWREDVYRTGIEAKGRVTDIEPPGSGRRDHIVRVEFFAQGALVRASVIGCPLASKGLKPLDDVAIIYDETSPMRCIVVRKTAPEIVDAIFDD